MRQWTKGTRALAIGGVVPALLALAGCTYHVTVVNRSHPGEGDKRARAALVVGGPYDVRYEGSVEPEFGRGKPEDRILDYLCHRLPITLQDSSCFSDVDIDTLVDATELGRRTLKLRGRHSFAAPVPDIGTKLSLRSDARIVIVIWGMRVESSPSVHIMSTGGFPLSAIPRKPLVITANFYIWDNEERCMVAHGSRQAAVDYGPAVTMRAWDRVTQILAGQMLSGTNFHRCRCKHSRRSCW